MRSYLEDGKQVPPSYQHLRQLRPHVSIKPMPFELFASSFPTLPIKLVAAEAGFLPPGPDIDFADMV
jgi:hypothetical protein